MTLEPVATAPCMRRSGRGSYVLPPSLPPLTTIPAPRPLGKMSSLNSHTCMPVRCASLSVCPISANHSSVKNLGCRLAVSNGKTSTSSTPCARSSAS